jgi:hypothetical protein
MILGTPENALYTPTYKLHACLIKIQSFRNYFCWRDCLMAQHLHTYNGRRSQSVKFPCFKNTALESCTTSVPFVTSTPSASGCSVTYRGECWMHRKEDDITRSIPHLNRACSIYLYVSSAQHSVSPGFESMSGDRFSWIKLSGVFLSSIERTVE